MHITGFKAENFKRLKAVEIAPDGNTVVIAGRNAQGKSSVLDAIWAALAGKNGVKEVVRPIRDGESKASVVVELDDIVVTRKWTPAGSNLTVTSRDGAAKFSSPQTVLDKLIGALSFDPLAFAEADAKTQRTQLLKLSGLEEELGEIERHRKGLYDRRTEVNREAKRARTLYDELGIDADVPVEPVDVASLMEEVRTANERETLLREHQQIVDQLNVLQSRLHQVVARGRELPATRTLSQLDVALAEVKQTNEASSRHEVWKARRADLENINTEVIALNKAIDQDDDSKAALLANADLPVAGLGVDDEGVTFNGVPFIQSSAAERLKVSVAMAMAANPEVRVICIKDASLLDGESRAALVAMAREHDYQIWYEVVGDGGPTGVVIEDGMVQA